MGDGGIISAFGWYILGIFSYRIFSTALGLGQISNLVQKVVGNSLKLLIVCEKQVSVCNEMKYDSLKSSGHNQEHIDFLKESDKNLISAWKTNSVMSIVDCLSEKNRRLVSVETWEDAQRYVNRKN